MFGQPERKLSSKPAYWKRSSGWWYMESIQPIGINEIIADIKLIYAAYLIFAVAVKSESRKIRPLANKKGKSRWSDSSYELWLQNNIQSGFLLNIGWITDVVHIWDVAIEKMDITKIFRLRKSVVRWRNQQFRDWKIFKIARWYLQ